MTKNRFSKLTSLTQGAAVVGIGVATAAACAVNETPVQAPSTVNAPAPPSMAAGDPAPGTNTPAPPATTPEPGSTTTGVNAPVAMNAMPGNVDGGAAPSMPTGVNAVTQPPGAAGADGGAVRTPGSLNAVRSPDGGAPHKHPHPKPNALPPNNNGQ